MSVSKKLERTEPIGENINKFIDKQEGKELILVAYKNLTHY